MEIGGDTGVSGKQKKKKRYHRHTPRQIHDLEAYAFILPFSILDLLDDSSIWLLLNNVFLFVCLSGWQCVQGMSASRREAKDGVEQRFGIRTKTDQVLVPKQTNADEGFGFGFVNPKPPIESNLIFLF